MNKIVVHCVYNNLHNVSADKVWKKDDATKLISHEGGIPPSMKMNAPIKNYRVREVQDDKFEAFDKIEKQWLEKAHEIIGADKYEIYLGMRDQCDREKMQAYKEFHNYLRQKYGDKFSYNITEDQSVREKQINQRYLKDLLKLIGPEKFKNYTNIKDQFNEMTRRENKESLQVEF
jgi:hypothetical protein